MISLRGDNDSCPFRSPKGRPVKIDDQSLLRIPVKIRASTDTSSAVYRVEDP